VTVENGVDIDQIAMRLRRRRRPGELAIRGFLYLCGALTIAITIGILYELGTESFVVLQEGGVGLLELLNHTLLPPQVGRVGISPQVQGTG
jgi:ABC-type phosphate transport system permease subunit